jgi:anti-repressor protein
MHYKYLQQRKLIRKEEKELNDLIKITEKNGKQLVSAKELYLGLGLNKSQWSRWYPVNIINNEFFHVGHDFVGVRLDVEGNETVDYAISLEFAKHIAMMARTEKSYEYRNYFIECEDKLKELHKPTCVEDVLIQSLQEMKDMRLQVQEAKQQAAEVKEEVQAIRDVVTINPNAWRAEVQNLLNKIAIQRGGTCEAYKEVRDKSYKLLNERAGAKLEIRLTNRRRKVLEETGSKSKSNKVSKLDVIADDKRLTEVYLAIVKEMAIKYKVA